MARLHYAEFVARHGSQSVGVPISSVPCYKFNIVKTGVLAFQKRFNNGHITTWFTEHAVTQYNDIY
jgi:hypothetical protein